MANYNVTILPCRVKSLIEKDFIYWVKENRPLKKLESTIGRMLLNEDLLRFNLDDLNLIRLALNAYSKGLNQTCNKTDKLLRAVENTILTIELVNKERAGM